MSEWMIYLLNAGLLVSLCSLFYKVNNQSEVIVFFWWGLFIKFLFTVIAGFYYQGADATLYFEASKRMNEFHELDSWGAYWRMIFYSEFKSDYWKMGTVFWGEPRALLMAKTLSLLNIITGKSYWLNSLYLSLFSYFGTFFFLKNIYRHYPRLKYAALVVFLFLPSTVFNSSGLVKESLAFGSICFVLGFMIQVFLNKRSITLWGTVGFLLGVLVLYKFKYYYLAVILPTLYLFLFFNFVKQITRKRRWYVYLGGMVLMLGIVFFVSQIHHTLAADKLVSEMSRTYHSAISGSESGKVIHYLGDPTLDGIGFYAKNAPKALLYGLLGPFPWEVSNVAMTYVVLEQLCLFVLLFVLLYQLTKGERWSITALEMSLIFYILCLATILPLVAPNFGTLTRYKVSYLPFLFTLVLGNVNFAKSWLKATFERNFFQKKKKI